MIELFVMALFALGLSIIAFVDAFWGNWVRLNGKHLLVFMSCYAPVLAAAGLGAPYLLALSPTIPVYGALAAFSLPILVDCGNSVSRFRKPSKPANVGSSDYTIIIPLYGSSKHLENQEYLKRFRKNVLICVPDKEIGLIGELERKGFNVLPVKVPRNKIQRHVALIKGGISHASTKFVCPLDADTTPEGDLGTVCAAMERDDTDLASVNVLPSANSNLLERMQKVEYGISMLTRHYQPWLTSGACSVGRTEVMREVMEHHSNHWFAEDIERGAIASNMKKKVAHFDFKVYTKVPSTFFGWFKQRVNWAAGGFRLAIVNADKHVRRHPWYLLYTLVFVYGLCVLKWYFLFMTPWLILPLLLIYIPVTLLPNWQVRRRDMVIFPLYATFQTLAMPILGTIKYLYLSLRYRTMGRIR